MKVFERLTDSSNECDGPDAAPHPALKLGYVAPRTFSSTTARIENAMRIVAYLIADQGEHYLPIFQRLERELEAHHMKEGSLRRALEITGKTPKT